jgi:rare lipoprotein A
MIRCGAVLALALLALTGCSRRHATRPAPAPSASTAAANAGRYAQAHDSTPDTVPDIRAIPEPVPRAEPRSTYGNKSPYTVLGKTYRVLPSCVGYRERGLASWYGRKFHGYTTSNFEKYDMYAYTAASKVLPIPCYVRVTNLDNGRSTIVRVNDRGPFVDGRIIDLSFVAAVKIGVYPRGTARVEVSGIDPSSTPTAEPDRNDAVPPRPANRHVSALYLQAASFADAGNAERTAKRLRAARLGPVRVTRARIGGRRMHRVLLGPLRDAEAAAELAPKLRALGLGATRITIED